MPHTILQAKRLQARLRPLPRARSGFASVLAASPLAALIRLRVGAARGGIEYSLRPRRARPRRQPRPNMPAVKVLAVSAPRDLDSDAFVYRLQYADAQRTGDYSNSHWTMPPAQLAHAASARRAGGTRHGADRLGHGTRARAAGRTDRLRADFRRPGQKPRRSLRAGDAHAAGQGDRPAHVHVARAVRHRRCRGRRAGARRPHPTNSSRRCPPGSACSRSSRRNEATRAAATQRRRAR